MQISSQQDAFLRTSKEYLDTQTSIIFAIYKKVVIVFQTMCKCVYTHTHTYMHRSIYMHTDRSIYMHRSIDLSFYAYR